ncbi:MAG: hypothetical protein ACKVS8_03445 [Phycisphaerales bacterium]
MPEPATERYTIRRKVFRLFGAGFHVHDPAGKVVAFCEQKAFRLREDLRVYTDDSKATEFFRIGTQQVLDFAATYTASLPDGQPLGSLRRKGLKSLLRDEWEVCGAGGEPLAVLREDSGAMAIFRRLADGVAWLSPQTFQMTHADGRHLATLRQHFNPFVYRLGVAIHAEDPDIDDLLILAAACLVAAIEGRQSD